MAIGSSFVRSKAQGPLRPLHAILRVGGVYVPIDPAAPADRVVAQVSLVSPRLVLTDAARSEAFSDVVSDGYVMDISQPLPELSSKEALHKRRYDRAADDAAYILMTSGTTGAPKGIVHTHKSGLAYARMASKLCRLTASDRVSHHTPVHFDMSIF